MKILKVLVACEESQAVTKQFRLLGHEAYSCDILDCSGNNPEWHIKDDVLNHINNKWDLIIAHPPCTYLCNAASRWLFPKGVLNQERYEKGLKAKEFFMKLYNAPTKRICVENPTPSKIFELPEYTQKVQPYQFGEPYSKGTLLWLKNLPKLKHTEVLSEYDYWCSNGYRRVKGEPVYGVARSSKQRSKTFQGIAKAMANQWSKYIINEETSS